ncbi:MAG: hypothetical protein KF760_03585 [Candidatus Eremiobacteraeota bacterium]|nr:hypothetical protein [Candidatus Eremiobacteraeota bacterium]
MLMMLWLTAAVAAEGSPREWVLTIDDLKNKLGAKYRPNPRNEKLQYGDYLVSGYYVYSYTDTKRGIFMVSQVNRDLSSWDARMSYMPMKWGAKYGFDERGATDYSKTVAAGEESAAYRSASGDSWMFTFRQRKAWGMLILGGFSLTPKEMDGVVDGYVARVNLVQVRKKPPSKPRGIWRWP